MSLSVPLTSSFRPVFFLLSLMFVCVIPDTSYAQAIPDGARCAECGMAVNGASKFSSEVDSVEGKKLFFCDIGDMLVHFRSSREKIKTVYVKDYAKGEWIDGKKAYYVLDRKFATPMSWNIAAFRDEAEAMKRGNAVDFNGAFRLPK